MQPLQSEKIADLVGALAKANGDISHAIKDATNPHFGNDFAKLESVIDATKGAYLANGIVVIQQPAVDEAGRTLLVTTLAHVSGQWFRSYTPVLSANANDPQKMGSGITYARRYALAAMANIGQHDDDGQAAAGKGSQAQSEDEKLAAISNLTKKLRQIGVSEKMICERYKIKSVSDINENEFSELNDIGSAIVNKKKPVTEFFRKDLA